MESARKANLPRLLLSKVKQTASELINLPTIVSAFFVSRIE
jgi:hypothetical protein